MTHSEIRALLARCNPRQLREDSRISRLTVQRALKVSRHDLYRWEAGLALPTCPEGVRWARLIRVLEAHAAVSAELAAAEQQAAA